MPRPKKCRSVCFVPDNQYFYPAQENEEEVVVIVEEIEALRLSDFEGMEQDIASEKMNVSRGTFQRIINQARFKIADALVNGKAIKISGGHYEVVCGKGLCKGRCKDAIGCERYNCE
jgi:predicted DNA-binding protein (UPF0251 family)